MKKISAILMASALLLCGSITTFAAKPMKVGIVLSTGGLGDKSFNDSAYRGLVKAKEELGIDFKYVEPASPAEDEQYLREYADAGYDLIIATGFQMKDAATNVANDYPEQKFAMVDDLIELPNVKSLTFAEDEGSFLAGAMAAMMSKTGVIGFIGGMEVPLIKKFQRGYEEGAKYINPDIKVISTYTASQNPFNDPVKGKENTISQIKQGADVIYHAAAGTGLGVIDAAKENGVFAIGVDSNQDDVAPGTVLTSMIKNVDIAVFDTVKETQEGNFTPGQEVFGVKNDGVGLTDFRFTKDKIGEANLQRLQEIIEKIKSGEIKFN